MSQTDLQNNCKELGATWAWIYTCIFLQPSKYEPTLFSGRGSCIDHKNLLPKPCLNLTAWKEKPCWKQQIDVAWTKKFISVLDSNRGHSERMLLLNHKCHHRCHWCCYSNSKRHFQNFRCEPRSSSFRPRTSATSTWRSPSTTFATSTPRPPTASWLSSSATKAQAAFLLCSGKKASLTTWFVLIRFGWKII